MQDKIVVDVPINEVFIKSKDLSYVRDNVKNTLDFLPLALEVDSYEDIDLPDINYAEVIIDGKLRSRFTNSSNISVSLKVFLPYELKKDCSNLKEMIDIALKLKEDVILSVNYKNKIKRNKKHKNKCYRNLDIEDQTNDELELHNIQSSPNVDKIY